MYTYVLLIFSYDSSNVKYARFWMALYQVAFGSVSERDSAFISFLIILPIVLFTNINVSFQTICTVCK